MNDERIEAALQEATDTRSVTIGAGVLASVADAFEEGFGNHEAVVVADENTFRVAGQEVQRHLEAAPAISWSSPTYFPESLPYMPNTAISRSSLKRFGNTMPSPSPSAPGP